MPSDAKDQDKEMSFWDHLDELRGTCFRSALVLCLTSCIGLFFKSFLFDGIILPPTRSDFCVYRFLHWDFSVDLINIDLTAQFFVHLRASLAAGLVLAFPYIIYEIWRFIAPALYSKEKKAMRTAFVMSSGLFYVGTVVGYFIVLPVCLKFFVDYNVSPGIVNSITLGSYMSLFFSMVLLIGLVFEFPTVAMVLSKLGIITRDTLRKGRKIAAMIILVVAAIITPADPFSMIVLAIPLYLLYELSIPLCSKSTRAA